jgi:hypothetical protein
MSTHSVKDNLIIREGPPPPGAADYTAELLDYIGCHRHAFVHARSDERVQPAKSISKFAQAEGPYKAWVSKLCISLLSKIPVGLHECFFLCFA